MRTIGFLLPLMLFTTHFSFTQDIQEEDIWDLFSQVVTSASRHEQESKLAPAAVTIITAEDIVKYGFTSIPDILRSVPGVYVRWTPMGETAGIRSFGQSPFSDRLLYLINGVPCNSPLQGGLPTLPHFLSFFPMQHIKQVEVIRGPSSALYGGNAFWGIVNIITKEGDDFNKHLDKRRGEGEFGFYGGSRETQRYALSYGQRVQRFETDLQWSATARYQRELGVFDYMRDSDAHVELWDLYANGQVKDFFFSLLHHDDSNQSFTYGPVDTLPSDQTLDIATVTWEKAVSASFEVIAKGSYMRREGTSCGFCHSPQIFTRPDPIIIRSGREENKRIWGGVQVNYRATSHHYLLGGVEVYRDQIDKEVDRRVPPLPPLDPLGVIYNFGVFAQDEANFLEGKLHLTLGARYDQHDISGGSFSPRIALVYVARPDLIFRTSFNRAHKEPSWNDLFSQYEFRIDHLPTFRQIITSNEGLVKEKIDALEGGLEYFFTERTSLKADLFYHWINDFIYIKTGPTGDFGPDQTIRSSAYLNDSGTTESRGGEVELRHQWSDYFQSNLSGSYQNFNLDRNNPITPYSHVTKVSFGMLLGPWKDLNGSLRVHYWGNFYPSDLYFTSEEEVQRASSFTIMDTRIAYRLPFFSQAIEIALIGRDLLDKNQQTPPNSTLFHLPGREVFIEARINF